MKPNNERLAVCPRFQKQSRPHKWQFSGLAKRLIYSLVGVVLGVEDKATMVCLGCGLVRYD